MVALAALFAASQTCSTIARAAGEYLSQVIALSGSFFAVSVFGSVFAVFVFVFVAIVNRYLSSHRVQVARIRMDALRRPIDAPQR